MTRFGYTIFSIVCLLTISVRAQPPMRWWLNGQFLTDSIEIGRPFQYALTYHHPAVEDVLFPDTSRHFAPYQVRNVTVFATQTAGTGTTASSRDSAVYTLVSFEIDSRQLLRVPVRILHETDCTAQWTQVDTVFLRSRLSSAGNSLTLPRALTLATETTLAPLQQQFNYGVLAVGMLAIGIGAGLLYGLFGRVIRRQWQLYQLNRRHLRFLNEYNRFSRNMNSLTAADTANQAVVLWKIYLEQLDQQPYTSLTTPEIAERMNDESITNALREADRMIYGGTFTPQSQAALRVLSDVATQAYHRRRENVQGLISQVAESWQQPDSIQSTPFS